ncbi:MAG: hypothetical protein ACRC1H_06825 [Caldilineaceae bacterium]
MAWIATAIIGTNVLTSAYSADRSRKATNKQIDAQRAALEDDKRETAEAETMAQVAANARTADSKRRRRASSLLAGGDPAADTLGGGSVLAGGGQAALVRPATGTSADSGVGGGSVLGSGAPRAGRVTTPRTPARRTSI